MKSFNNKFVYIYLVSKLCVKSICEESEISEKKVNK